MHHLQSCTGRPFQSVTFSSDGKYLAAGESAFTKPEIVIWQVDYQSDTKSVRYTFLKSLKGHKFGVESLRFSPNGVFLVSLGDQNDRGLFVWRWQ